MSEEEAILDEDVEREVDEALSSHEKQVLPQEVPTEGVQTEVLSWGHTAGTGWFTTISHSEMFTHTVQETTSSKPD